MSTSNATACLTEHDARARSLGVSEEALRHADAANAFTPHHNLQQPHHSKTLRVAQWNTLAQALSNDGFLVVDATSEKLDEAARKNAEAAVQLAAARERGADELQRVGALHAASASKRSLAALIDWPRRLAAMKHAIASLQPDILTMQETDRMAEVKHALEHLGYSCTLNNGTAAYSPALDAFGDVAPDRAAFADHLAGSRIAFIPVVPSSARRIAQREGHSTVDDDGCAIFWRTDAWEANRIDYLVIDGGKKMTGAVGVLLSRRSDGAPLFVMSSHLKSGSSNEHERLAEIEAAGLLRRGGDGSAADSQTSIRAWFADSVCKGPTIFCLDANSAPGRREELTVWKALRGVPGSKSVWDAWWSADGVLLQHETPVTTNKMRGPLTEQPSKMGEHACEAIDHIYFGGGLGAPQHAWGPVVFGGARGAYDELLPSLAVPSDHYPVVVDLTLDS